MKFVNLPSPLVDKTYQVELTATDLAVIYSICGCITGSQKSIRRHTDHLYHSIDELFERTDGQLAEAVRPFLSHPDADPTAMTRFQLLVDVFNR